jgi:hypothetical protein
VRLPPSGGSVRAVGWQWCPPVLDARPPPRSQVILTLLLFGFLAVDAAPLLSWPLVRWAIGARRAEAAESALVAPWDAEPGAYESTGALGPASEGARAAFALSRSAWRSVRPRDRMASQHPGAEAAAPAALGAAPAPRNEARRCATWDARAADERMGERV